MRAPEKIKMKNISQNIGTPTTLVALPFFLLVMLSCSGDNNDSDNNLGTGPNIDFAEISGEYTGTSSNSFGTVTISMRIRPQNIIDQYSVEFYATGNLVSCCNSNGNPEALGDLTIDNGELTIDLRWNTDTPPCRGDYTGTNGTFDMGEIRIAMDAMLDCSEDDITDDVLLSKVADL